MNEPSSQITVSRASNVPLRRVFLGGTTAGTTWRVDLIDYLLERGVLPEQIINPHLPKGVHYTDERKEQEVRDKADPNTIVLIHIRPAAIRDLTLAAEVAFERSERLGPISMYEIGTCTHAPAFAGRVAVSFDIQAFTERSRSRNVLQGLANELRAEFGDGPGPYFDTVYSAADWIIPQLTQPPRR